MAVKGLKRFEARLSCGVSFSSASEGYGEYSVTFTADDYEGFCDGQRVVVTVEALEEPGE